MLKATKEIEGQGTEIKDKMPLKKFENVLSMLPKMFS